VRTFSIFGSGDIWEAADIFRMIDQTGVAGVSVARGCIGNPWVFRQARALLAGDADAARRPPTVAEQRDVLREHFELSVKLHGEKKAGMMMRKFGIKFSRHHPQAEQIKDAFIRVKSLADWQDVLDRFYGDESGPSPLRERLGEGDSGPSPFRERLGEGEASSKPHGSISVAHATHAIHPPPAPPSREGGQCRDDDESHTWSCEVA
jgi:hypothetical protein